MRQKPNIASGSDKAFTACQILAQPITSAQRATGKIFPDGRGTIGYIPSQKKALKADTRQLAREEDAFWYEIPGSEEKVYISREDAVRHGLCDREEAPLNFISSPKSSQKSKPYGRRGITGYGKKMLRSGAILLEKKYTKKRLVFGTATLPSYEAKDMDYLNNEGWSDVVRQFIQAVKRKLMRRGCPHGSIVYCTEIQEKRTANRDDGIQVLHLHWVCRGISSGNRYMLPAAWVRRIWSHICYTAICRYRDRRANDDTDASYGDDKSVSPPDYLIGRVRLERIHTSVVGYLAKYLSKGNSAPREGEADSSENRKRSTWWGMGSSLRKAVLSSVQRMDADVAEAIMCMDAEELKQFGIHAFYCHTILHHNREIVVGSSWYIKEGSPLWQPCQVNDLAF